MSTILKEQNYTSILIKLSQMNLIYWLSKGSRSSTKCFIEHSNPIVIWYKINMPALSIKRLICLCRIKNQLEDRFRCSEMREKKMSTWNVWNTHYFSSINCAVANSGFSKSSQGLSSALETAPAIPPLTTRWRAPSKKTLGGTQKTQKESKFINIIWVWKQF